VADEHTHRPVLLREVLDALRIQPEGVYVDGTFGRGGHSAAILAALGASGKLLAIDKDPQAVVYGREHFGSDERFSIRQGSFSMLQTLLIEEGQVDGVQGVLFDLGVSSPQLDSPERGFSFKSDGPLDMRMNVGAGTSAADWLAVAREQEISDVLWRFGEERFARRIARAIVSTRTGGRIATTRQLAGLIERVVPTREQGKHPATRSFQAIRIHINRELDDLREGLAQTVQVLAAGGRLAVISFHSLEDRIVKRFMREQASGNRFPTRVPVTDDHRAPSLRVIGKPIRPPSDEIESNPRARSAVLRVAERTP
jgi:16S rRNA (cytosine1402-N4)-methyltransferase